MAGGVADQRGGLRLAEAVAQRQAPGLLDLLDDLRVERLARADQFAQRQAPAIGGQVLLDQHAPHGGRRAQAGHPVPLQHAEQGRGAEARDVVDEHAGAGVPRREQAAPGVLGPTRRGDVEVDVAGLQADPVHRGEVPDRVALVAVQHHLRLGGGAGGEVQQQRVVGAGRAIGGEGGGIAGRGGVGHPAGNRRADADAGAALGEAGELVSMGAADHQVANLAALDAVAQVVGGQQGGGGDHHGAELEGRQHGFPQRDMVAEHQQDALATAHAQLAQVVGDAVGAFGQLGEAVALLAAVLLDDPQRRCLVAPGQRIEVVQRPVELAQLRPAEVARGGGVVAAVGQQEVAGGQEGAAVGVHAAPPAGWMGRSRSGYAFIS
ncbi:hypothetical protein D9M69_364650 [compost metagenome]